MYKRQGFAFAAASDDFAELKGTQLILDIPDFPVKEERTMEGVVTVSYTHLLQSSLELILQISETKQVQEKA